MGRGTLCHTPLRASFIHRSSSMRLNLTTALPLAFVLVSGCWRRTEMAAVWHEPDRAC